MFLIFVSFLFLPKKQVSKKNVSKKVTHFFPTRKVSFNLPHRPVVWIESSFVAVSKNTWQESHAESLDLKLAEVRSSCNEVRIDLERHWSRQAQEPKKMAGVECMLCWNHGFFDITCNVVQFLIFGNMYIMYIYI